MSKKNKLLTDEEIQNYLDNPLEKNTQIPGESSQEKVINKKNIMAYKEVYNVLGSDEGIMLSANFADTVIAKIEAQRLDRWDWLENLGLFLLGLATFGFILFFTDMGSSLLQWANTLWLQLADTAANTDISIHRKWRIPAYIGIILTAIGMLDKVLLHRKNY